MLLDKGRACGRVQGCLDAAFYRELAAASRQVQDEFLRDFGNAVHNSRWNIKGLVRSALLMRCYWRQGPRMHIEVRWQWQHAFLADFQLKLGDMVSKLVSVMLHMCLPLRR